MTDQLRESTYQLIDSLKQTCGSAGMGNDGNEYKIVVQMFLYKYFNDKFAYEAKQTPDYGERLSKAEKWDAEYDKFTEEEVSDLFCYLPSNTPQLQPWHTVSHLFNSQGQGDFAGLLDATMVEIAHLNADRFAVQTVGKTKVTIFEPITVYVRDVDQRDNFARALMKYIADPKTNFEPMFAEKYDFFSAMFEQLIKDYNKDGGGKYAEYYTPRSIALIMARLLVGNDKDLRSVTAYDPSAGTGTLLMALAHVIGEERCNIYAQDISQKSSQMLMLNLILNNLVSSIPNIIQGNTLLNPGHKNEDGTLRQFDYIVSNPPFKLDFPDERDAVANTGRFWAGVPNKPREINPNKPAMKIYLCFIQHVLNQLKEGKGKGAIVVPTGFITASTGIEKKIFEKIIKENHWVYGCVSMPSNVFATTGTNVSVLFFDKSASHDKVVLIDASKLGEKRKDGNNQRTFLRDYEIEKIIETFLRAEPVEDFCAVVSYEEIEKKKFALAAGYYFDVKIEHQEISQEEFQEKMYSHKKTLDSLFEESSNLEHEILDCFDQYKLVSE